jgi:hypothetical protein
MYNRFISLLTLLLLTHSLLGRPFTPTHPGAVSPAKVAAAPPISDLQAVGPFGLWLQFTNLFLDVATLGGREDANTQTSNSTALSPDTEPETSPPQEDSALPTLRTLRVQIVDRDSGAPFVHGKVELVDLQGTVLRSVDSIDSNGFLTYEDIQPGYYLPSLASNLFGKERQYVCVPRPIVVRPGLEQSVVIEIQEGIQVKGQMMGIGTRVPAVRDGASLWVYLAGTDVFVNAAPINDPDGTWVMYLPEGSFDVYYHFGVDAIHPQGRFSMQPVLISVDRRRPPDHLSLHLSLIIES